MNIEIKIRRKQHGKPADTLEDAKIHVIGGELEGLKLVGFAIGNGARALVEASLSSCTRRPRATRAARRKWPRVAGAGPGADSERGRAHRKLMNQKQTSE